jgi:hypothetical protein
LGELDWLIPQDEDIEAKEVIMWKAESGSSLLTALLTVSDVMEAFEDIKSRLRKSLGHGFSSGYVSVQLYLLTRDPPDASQ